MDGDGIGPIEWRRMRNDNFIRYVNCLHNNNFAVVGRLYYSDQSEVIAMAETIVNK